MSIAFRVERNRSSQFRGIIFVSQFPSGCNLIEISLVQNILTSTVSFSKTTTSNCARTLKRVKANQRERPDQGMFAPLKKLRPCLMISCRHFHTCVTMVYRKTTNKYTRSRKKLFIKCNFLARIIHLTTAVYIQHDFRHKN